MQPLLATRARLPLWLQHAPVACPGAVHAPGEPDPRRRQPSPSMPRSGHAGPTSAPAHDHVTARAARICPVPSGTRRWCHGLVPARCSLILHLRAARGPAPGPPILAAGAPIHRGRARQRAPPADTGGLFVHRTAAQHRRDRRRTARFPPSCPDHPGDDGGGRAGIGGRTPRDDAHASLARASWSAVRLPCFTRPPPRPSHSRAFGVSEFRTE